jgi:hypothetical protein
MEQLAITICALALAIASVDGSNYICTIGEMVERLKSETDATAQQFLDIKNVVKASEDALQALLHGDPAPTRIIDAQTTLRVCGPYPDRANPTMVAYHAAAPDPINDNWDFFVYSQRVTNNSTPLNKTGINMTSLQFHTDVGWALTMQHAKHYIRGAQLPVALFYLAGLDDASFVHIGYVNAPGLAVNLCGNTVTSLATVPFALVPTSGMFNVAVASADAGFLTVFYYLRHVYADGLPAFIYAGAAAAVSTASPTPRGHVIIIDTLGVLQLASQAFVNISYGPAYSMETIVSGPANGYQPGKSIATVQVVLLRLSIHRFVHVTSLPIHRFPLLLT